MDLMTLVAHVTLDTSEYEQALNDAQKEAEKLNIKEDYSLDLDNSGFTESLNEAEGDAENFESNINSVWENIKTGLITAGVAAAITGLFTQLSDCVNLAAKLGDNVDKGSKRLNISTDAYQEWGHALEQNGASINDLQRGILSMNKLLGGGEVPKSAAEAFEKLGISATKASGGLKTTEEYLADTMKALADFSGTSEERGALVEAIFGHNGNQLNALFDTGSKGIDDLIKEAHELGLVMAGEQIEKSVAYGDAVANLQSTIDGLKVSFAEGVIPVLTSAVEMVTRIVAFFNGNAKENSLADSFKNTNKELTKDLVSIEGTSAAAMTLIDKLFAMGDAEKLTAEQQAEWKATAEWLITNIPTLSGNIDLDTQSISGNTEELQKNIAEWRNYAIQRAKASALEKQQEALAQKTTEWLEKAADAKKLEADYTKKQAEVEALLIRDYKNMPADVQSRFMQRFGYGSEAEMDWTSGSKLYGQLENALGSWNQEWGFSSYGSQELIKAIDERSIAQQSIAEQLKAAQDEAEKLRLEVEQGQEELANYDTVLTEIINSIIPTASEAKTDVEDVGKAVEDLPERKTILIDVIAKYPNVQLPGLDFHPHATGAWDIPYDDYPALLHKDEMVLTAAQAREYRNNHGGGISTAQFSDLIEAIDEMRSSITGMKLYVGDKNFARVIGQVADKEI